MKQQMIIPLINNFYYTKEGLTAFWKICDTTEACGTQWRAEERGRERQWEDGRTGKCTRHLKLLKEGRGGNTLFEPFFMSFMFNILNVFNFVIGHFQILLTVSEN